MKPDELPPLSDELRELIDQAEVPSPPPDFTERVWSRISTTTPGLPNPAVLSRGALAGLSLAVGLVAGVAVDRWVLAPPTVVVLPSVTAPATPTVAPPPPEVRPTPPTAPPVGLQPTPPTPPAPAKPGSDGALARERTLLEMARTALRRGEAASALAHAERHATEFPRGQLGEEREVVRIQSLLSLGRRAEAREQALRFQRIYPESLLTPVIAPALAE